MKYMGCLCYLYDTTLRAKTPQEAADMLEVFAAAIGNFGLEVDVPEAGTVIYPNQPRATMTACCANCTAEGVKLSAAIDPETMVCPICQKGYVELAGHNVGPRRNLGGRHIYNMC